MATDDQRRARRGARSAAGQPAVVPAQAAQVVDASERPANDAPIMRAVSFLELVTIVVDDYDPAIEFFVGTLGFDLVEDSASLTNDGRAKRWVVVRPSGAQTGILLARADGERQSAVVGNQLGGRVGFFLRVDDFTGSHDRMVSSGVKFVTPPRVEAYGKVAVFLDIAGNRWDLLGPA